MRGGEGLRGRDVGEWGKMEEGERDGGERGREGETGGRGG